MTSASIDDLVLVLGSDCLLDQYGSQPIATFLKQLTFNYIIHVTNNQTKSVGKYSNYGLNELTK
jgi:hypothetical protein